MRVVDVEGVVGGQSASGDEKVLASQGADGRRDGGQRGDRTGRRDVQAHGLVVQDGAVDQPGAQKRDQTPPDGLQAVRVSSVSRPQVQYVAFSGPHRVSLPLCAGPTPRAYSERIATARGPLSSGTSAVDRRHAY